VLGLEPLIATQVMWTILHRWIEVWAEVSRVCSGCESPRKKIFLISGGCQSESPALYSRTITCFRYFLSL
jgi:hypothetical protein